MPNFRLALRSLLRTPLVTTVAVLSLALGIGANAAIFSLFERMILRPLPVEEPERLVNLLAPGPKSGSRSVGNAGGVEAVFSYPMYRDLEAGQTALAGIAAHSGFWANLSTGEETSSVDGFVVSGSYFDTLGVRPALGRLFSRSDDLKPGGHPVVVLSHAFWQNQFGARNSVVGEILTVNGLPMTVLGVTPEEFTGTTRGTEPHIFVPLSMQGAMMPGWDGFEDRRTYWIYVFGRLAPGSTHEQAAAGLNVLYQGLIREVELSLQGGASEATLERFKNKEIVLEPGRRGQSSLLQELRPSLLLLLGVSGLVFLIACANLANLLLIRATSRGGEIGVRLALGARRYQVVIQLLTESLLLAAAGCAFGLLVAKGTLQLMLSLLPEDQSLGASLDFGPPFLLFLGGLVALTALTGLFPALHATGEALGATLKGQAGRVSISRTANRFRAAMVTLQIALSMALLVAAGLFSKSLLNVSRVDLGIEVESIATFGLSPELNRYSFNESRQLFERLERELGALHGVTGVAASMVPLITGNNWGSSVAVQGFVAEPDARTTANFNLIGPGFFSTLGIPLLAGREFEASDDAKAPKVVIINEAFARKFNLGRDAVGKRMAQSSRGELEMEIVGLVADSGYSDVKETTRPVFYMPYRQDEEVGAINFYLRAQGDPAVLLPVLRRYIASIDSTLPVEGLRTLRVLVHESISMDRLLSVLSTSFALLATLLAAIGLYGVMAYSVSQRTREIGLRMALGADARRVRQLVLGRVGWMTLAGGVLGLAASLVLARLGRSLLFELEGNDPTVFAAAAIALTAIAFLAGYLPANRATKIEPMRALRDE